MAATEQARPDPGTDRTDPLLGSDPGGTGSSARVHASGTVTVRLFAAARDATGAGEVLLPAGPLDTLLAALRAGRGPRLAEVLAVSSLVCDGVRLDRTGPTPIPAGAVLDVLPPFAGG